MQIITARTAQKLNFKIKKVESDKLWKTIKNMHFLNIFTKKFLNKS